MVFLGPDLHYWNAPVADEPSLCGNRSDIHGGKGFVPGMIHLEEWWCWWRNTARIIEVPDTPAIIAFQALLPALFLLLLQNLVLHCIWYIFN